MSDPVARTQRISPETVASRMAVVPGIEGLDRSHGRLFVVVGVFDGLHLGHQYLLRELAREARQRQARPTVITFDHHPDEVLTGKAPPLLCDPDERLERLQSAGVEVTVVQTFDVALRETPYDTFIRRIADRVDLAGFLMTPESAFGFERRGTPETVAELGRDLGYKVVVAPPFTLNGQLVRSMDIRASIAAGDLATAARLLGRPVSVAGVVDAGTDGPVLRFPMPVALPSAGTYAARVRATGGEPTRIDAAVREGMVRLPRLLGAAIGSRLVVTFEEAG